MKRLQVTECHGDALHSQIIPLISTLEGLPVGRILINHNITELSKQSWG